MDRKYSLEQKPFLGSLALLIGLTCGSTGASAEDIFKMEIHPKEISGTWELHHAQYDRAITLLEIEAVRSKRTARAYGPILTNLCVAYTKVGNFEAATRYCDDAVKQTFDVGIAYNNRGVLEALKQNFAAASADFDIARKSRESAASAEHNIDQLGEQLSEFSGDPLPNTSSLPNV